MPCDERGGRGDVEFRQGTPYARLAGRINSGAGSGSMRGQDAIWLPVRGSSHGERALPDAWRHQHRTADVGRQGQSADGASNARTAVRGLHREPAGDPIELCHAAGYDPSLERRDARGNAPQPGDAAAAWALGRASWRDFVRLDQSEANVLPPMGQDSAADAATGVVAGFNHAVHGGFVNRIALRADDALAGFKIKIGHV